MSVWTSPEALFEFVYKTAHTRVMAQTCQVLFWIPAGHRPTVPDAMARLQRLRDLGPSPEAFTFKQRYPAPGELGGPNSMRPEPSCVA
jgi:hypothetical protein